MSKINGEKARSAIAKKNRTARRLKDRTRLAEIKASNAANAENASKADKAPKAEAKPAAKKSKAEAKPAAAEQSE